MSGRPVVVLAIPRNESAVRDLIRTLWLFVPGHSKNEKVCVNATLEATARITDLFVQKMTGHILASIGTAPTCGAEPRQVDRPLKGNSECALKNCRKICYENRF